MEIDVEHVARLARLGLSAEEKRLFKQQLSAILDYAENLKKIGAENVPPASHAAPIKNVFREDRAVAFENTDDIVANGPQIENGMFRVPKIIE